MFILFITGAIACVSKNIPGQVPAVHDYMLLHSGIRFFEMDPLGNLYIVDNTERLMKVDTTGTLVYNVVNNNLGQIHSVDAGSPFKIMVFYRDQQTLVFYDRTLSEIQRINLIDWELHDVTAAALSSDNAIWLFNGERKVLMKMSDRGDPFITSDPFDILDPPSARPDFIYDVDQFLVLKESGKPISIFDDFGKYRNAVETGESFTVSPDGLVSVTENGVLLFNIRENKETHVLPPPHPIAGRVYLHEGLLYGVDDRGVYLMHFPSERSN